MPKIYTKTGDDGSTGIFGGSRVSKADRRVDAYGYVDELNSVLGWVRAAKPTKETDEALAVAQEQCFRVGAFLASAKDPGVERIVEADVEEMERRIDDAEDGLTELKTFILPGGGETGARCHVARCVCRRAERAVVLLKSEVMVDPMIVKWLNRLSDLLFVLARWENRGTPETPWLGRKA